MQSAVPARASRVARPRTRPGSRRIQAAARPARSADRRADGTCHSRRHGRHRRRGRSGRRCRPKLVPAWAPVTVLTEPAGATVLVDGTAAGATPARLELGAGTHRIELRHAGFKDWVTDVQVVANQPQTLGPVRLGLPDGTLVVRTNPAGASVSVGGAFRGRTPLTIDVRPDVRMALVATHDGYEPATREVTRRRRASDATCELVADADPRRGHGAGRAGRRRSARERSLGRQGRADVQAAVGAARTSRCGSPVIGRIARRSRPGRDCRRCINVRLERGRVTARAPRPAAAAPGAAAAGAAPGGAATAARPRRRPLAPIVHAKIGAELAPAADRRPSRWAVRGANRVAAPTNRNAHVELQAPVLPRRRAKSRTASSSSSGRSTAPASSARTRWNSSASPWST